MSSLETPALSTEPRAEPEPEMAFERWAEVSARLLKRSPEERLDILEEVEIDPAAWSRADRRWIAQIAEDLDRGDEERPTRYAAVCSEELRGRKKEPKMSAPALVGSSSVAVSPAVAPKVGIGETVMDLGMILPKRALPFGDKPSQALPPAPAPTSPPKSGMSGQTLPAEVNLMALVTPFTKPSTPPVFSPAPTPPPAVSGDSAPPPALTTEAASPGVTAPGGTAPEMTVDAYASLCAEMAVFPQRRGDILRRYNIADDAALAVLRARWKERFGREPAMEMVWQEKYRTFRDWLAQNR